MSSDEDRDLLNYWLELDRHTHMRGRKKKSLSWLAKMTCPECKGGKSPQAKRCAGCANKGPGRIKKNKDIDIPKLKELLHEHARKTGFPYT